MDISLGYNKPDAPIHISHRKRNVKDAMPIYHSHDAHYEIYYLMNGKRKYFIKDRTYYIQSGDLVFINKGVLHRTFNVEENEHERLLINFTNYLFKDELASYKFLLQSIFNQTLIIQLNFHEKQEFESILYAMIKEIGKADEAHDLYLKALLTQLLILSVRYLNRNSAAMQESSGNVYNKVTDIIQYIQENYQSPDLSLQSIAEVFYISPYYLSRIFKNATGFTYTEFLNHLRIQKAQNILRESDMKVIDIAGKVGFNSLTHFGRVFKENTNYTPSAYRKLHKV